MQAMLTNLKVRRALAATGLAVLLAAGGLASAVMGPDGGARVWPDFNAESIVKEVAGRPEAAKNAAPAVAQLRAGETDGAAPGGSADYGLSLPALGQAVIKNATVSLTVKRGMFSRTYDQIAGVAAAGGGYVAGSNSSAYDGTLVSGTITIRVPSDRFDTVLAKIRRLGNLTALNINSEDVSTEMVDLNSRLRHWRAQETLLLKLMDKAETIGDSISIQQQLSQVQLEIERISGRLKFLEDQTSYSNIGVTVSEPGAAAAPVDPWGFRSALEQATHAFVDSVNGLILLIGYAGPYALLALLGILALRTRRRAASPETAGAN